MFSSPAYHPFGIMDVAGIEASIQQHYGEAHRGGAPFFSSHSAPIDECYRTSQYHVSDFSNQFHSHPSVLLHLDLFALGSAHASGFLPLQDLVHHIPMAGQYSNSATTTGRQPGARKSRKKPYYHTLSFKLSNLLILSVRQAYLLSVYR